MIALATSDSADLNGGRFPLLCLRALPFALELSPLRLHPPDRPDRGVTAPAVRRTTVGYRAVTGVTAPKGRVWP